MRAPSRLDTSPLARWWWSIDRVSLMLLGIIILVGFVLLMAAGPAAAGRLRIANEFHFPMRQVVFLVPAIAIMIGVSMLTALQARRLGVAVLGVALILMLTALVAGQEINGAKRWLSFGSFGLQPTEFLKPGFIIASAWMLAEGARNPKFPGAMISMALYFMCAFLMVLQPDFGQAALLTAVWMIMFFIAGWSWLWIAGLSAVGFSAIAAGYFFSPHLARRIDGFVNPGATETYQIDKAQQALQNGGLFGRGSEDVAFKHQLPDAHADFIYAVAVEEFGLFFGLLILALFAVMVIRFYFKASGLKSLFAQSAVCGLAAMVGLQSFINIGVNLKALPAKGMTLPFMSYGGSSLLAMGLSLGLIFALTRTPRTALRRKEIMP